MTATAAPTESERFARSLLTAWNSGDAPCLRNELSKLAVMDYSRLSTFEYERIEIVRETAQTIRVWLSGARKKHADLNVALGLLRHLATAEDRTC
jgi:hypothetical protein